MNLFDDILKPVEPKQENQEQEKQELVKQLQESVKAVSTVGADAEELDVRVEDINIIPLKKISKKRGLKVSVWGQQGSGKTHFGLTFPKPVFVIDTEMGTRPFASRKEFADGTYLFEVYVEKRKLSVKTLDPIASLLRTNYVISILKKLADRDMVGTIVIDSVTDYWYFCREYMNWEIVRLGGRLNKKRVPVDRRDWDIANTVYRQSILQLLTTNANVVLIARTGEEFVGTQPTGEYYPKWQKDTPFLVDIEIQANIQRVLKKEVATNPQENRFFGVILKCRHSPDLVGRIFEPLEFNSLKSLLDEQGISYRPSVDISDDDLAKAIEEIKGELGEISLEI